MGRNISEDLQSPVKDQRERSPSRHKNSHRGSPPEKERNGRRAKSPKRDSPVSRVSRSPSPRTKRLRRAQGEKEVEKVKEKERDRHNGRVSEKNNHRQTERNRDGDRDRDNDKDRDREREREREREKPRDKEREKERDKGREKEVGSERRDRRSGRDEMDGRSSRGRRERSTSPSDRHQRNRHRSRSPQSDSDTRMRDEGRNSRGGEGGRDNEDDDAVAKMKAAAEALEAKHKEKPSFELSGKLAAETNRVKGVTLLFTEPPDARKPNVRWRLYVFKAGEVLNEPLYIHRQSCYLFGRERRVADIPTDHPSCSKQHAVIQYRQVEKEDPDGMTSKEVRPYLMDLGSTNKTFLNENPIDAERYYELFERDTIKFGNSSREYVLLHENSAAE